MLLPSVEQRRSRNEAKLTNPIRLFQGESSILELRDRLYGEISKLRGQTYESDSLSSTDM
jgi:hypothetical protein